MTGAELIKMIKDNSLECADIWLGVNGKVTECTSVEPMFPMLSNTNEILIRDNNEVEQDEEFWETFYGSYMEIISEEQADKDFHNGNTGFYILYCDGTESSADGLTDEEWKEIKKLNVMFGYEK